MKYPGKGQFEKMVQRLGKGQFEKMVQRLGHITTYERYFVEGFERYVRDIEQILRDAHDIRYLSKA